MSLEEQILIGCPECGNEQQITVWSSLNIDIDSDQKQDFIEGKINLFKCEKCDYENHLPVPFYYHDMTNRIFCGYIPFGNLDDEEYLSQFHPNWKMITDDQPQVEIANYMKDPHISFSMIELLRYVVFREQLMKYYSDR